MEGGVVDGQQLGWLCCPAAAQCAAALAAAGSYLSTTHCACPPGPHCLSAGEGKGIELRHQRNPDVTFDCLAKAEGEWGGGNGHCCPALQCFTCAAAPDLALLACLSCAQWLGLLPPHPHLLAALPPAHHTLNPATAGGRRAVPEETFVAIETLLPTGKGSFLELWAPQGVRRPGWTHLVEVPEAAAGAAES